MDKHEYNIKLEEIYNLIEEREYTAAAELADSIDWGRVSKPNTLGRISDLYKVVHRLDDAIELMEMADHMYRTKNKTVDKDIVFYLCEMYCKVKDIVRAKATLDEFERIAGRDYRRYILRYRLYEATGVGLGERIEVLEELKRSAYKVRWAYELAYQYHRVGLETKCVEECDELLMLYASSGGKYVNLALELKIKHAALTPEQQELYDHRFDAYGGAPVSATEAQTPEVTAEADASVEQESDKPAEKTPEEGAGPLPRPSKSEQELLALGHTQIYKGIPEEVEISVPINNPGYNTTDLYELVQEGMSQVMEEGGEATEDASKSDTKPFPRVEGDTTKVLVGGAAAGGAATDEAVKAEASEQETEENGSATDLEATGEAAGEAENTADVTADESAAASGDAASAEEAHTEEMHQIVIGDPEGARTVYPTGQQPGMDVTGDLIRTGGTGNMYEAVAEEARRAQPPKEMADALTQEGDGQIGLVIPESSNVERQITGQIEISEVYGEWEKLKQETEQHNRDLIRQKLMSTTGKMFSAMEQEMIRTIDAAINGTIETPSEEPVEEPAAAVSEDTRDLTLDQEILRGLESEAEDVITEEDQVEELEEIRDPEEGDFDIPEINWTEESPAVEEVSEEPVSEEIPAEVVNASEEDTEYSVEEIPAEEPVAEEPVADEAVEEEIAEEIPEEEPVAEEIASEEVIEEPVEEPAEVPAEETAEASDTPESATETSEPVAKTPATPEEASVSEEDLEEVELRQVIEEEIRKDEAESDAEEKDAQTAPEETPKSKEVADEDTIPGVRTLTPEEKNLFAPYIQSKDARAQLINVIDNVSMAAFTGNIILVGNDDVDVPMLATGILKDLRQTESNLTGKIAKISGENLNSRNIAETIDKLENGALIIEKAGAMTGASVDDLLKALDTEKYGIVVILTENRRNLEKLLERRPALKTVFPLRMNVEALSGDKLVSYAKLYAREKEYSINEMGILALRSAIDAKETSTHAVTVLEVKEIVDKAIAKASKKSVGHFFDVVFGKRYDKEYMVILGEKDFTE